MHRLHVPKPALICRQLLITICIMVGCCQPSLAGSNPPEADRPPRTGGQSAGSRGCGLGQSNFLQLLTPNSNEHPITTTTPTFAWRQAESSDRPIEFRIYQEVSAQQPPKLLVELKNPLVELTNGISTLNWPTDLDPLQRNTQYIWQVELVCEPNRPSGNIFAEAPLLITHLETFN